MQTTVKNEASGFTLADLAAMAAESKVLAEDAMETGKRKAKRALRKGREIAEDYLEDASYYVRHHPWQSICIAIGVGAFAGVLVDLACRRLSKP